MRALFGFIVFAMAVSFAVVEFYLPPAARDGVVSSVARLGAPPPVENVPPPVRVTRRTFSPPSPLFSFVVDDRAPKPVDAPPPEVADAPSGPSSPMLSWSTVVTMAPSAKVATPGHGLGLAPADGNARYELVVDLQRELKRLGCYYGPLNGVWGARAKSAMSDFGGRVNAGLSIEQPDYALLTLLRGHGAQVCNAACAPGEVIARDGRCLASTVLARTHPSNAHVALAAPDVRRPVEPLPGRMSVGAPNVDLDGLATPSLNPDGDEPTASSAFDGSAGPPRAGRSDAYAPKWRAQKSARSRPSRSASALHRLPPNRRYVPPPRSLVTLR